MHTETLKYQNKASKIEKFRNSRVLAYSSRLVPYDIISDLITVKILLDSDPIINQGIESLLFFRSGKLVSTCKTNKLFKLSEHRRDLF